jgi:hypothetical protein|tara:strand:- start:9080 stop:11059 length:1980 start_codon:yes stop_codon:yes gene_type:complete
MTKFLKNISVESAGHVQFKTTDGTSAGKIEQDGNDLVLSNAVGDVLLGDGASDVYIGDGVNNVDILFEQSGSIKGDGSAVTLTLGGSNTTLNLENPNINGNLSIGLTSISDKLTFTGNDGYILFDREPSNYDGTTSIPLLKVDQAGTEKTILERVSANGGILLGADDTIMIAGGDTRAVLRANINETVESVVIASESGFTAYGFPGNDTSWANRNEFKFRSDSSTASENGLYIGDGGSVQFIDLSRNLKNIGTISSGSLDINGNADISGALTLGTNLAVAEGGTGVGTSTSWLNSNAFANFASSGADWDTITTRGIHRLTGATNNPFGTSHATGFTLTENSDNYGFQLFAKGSTNNSEHLMYRYRGSSWEDWQTIVTKTFGDGRYLKLAGGTMTGTNGVIMPDNFKLKLGTGSDLQIYHDGSNSYIKDIGTGNLRIDATNFFVRNSDGSKLAIDAVDGAEVNLRYNGSKKLETTNTGVLVTGELEATSLDINGNADISGNLVIAGTVDGVDISALPTTFAPTNAEQNVQSDWNATSGDALILNKPSIPAAITDYVSAANGGTFGGNIAATNLSGTNTGDQDLSGYLLNTTDTLTGRLTITSSVRVGNDTATATSANEGATRYYADANGSYMDMVMQYQNSGNSANDYKWTNVVRHIFPS